MQKKISLIQMNVLFGQPKKNFARATELVEQALQDKPDIIVFPETLNTGFFPRETLSSLADEHGQKTKEIFSQLAATHQVNIVAGSVATKKGELCYNTSYVFDRTGHLVAEYDKIHSFSPSEEDKYFQSGKNLSIFSLDGIKCGLAICYDLRFCELFRTLALQGAELIFLPAQWPMLRLSHWLNLTTARAIENQLFICAVNSCGTSPDNQFAGHSRLIDPWGEALISTNDEETIVTASMNTSIITDIRSRINVFQDRKPDLYHC